jgi:magnesium-transporting ATPase (P-type)
VNPSQQPGSSAHEKRPHVSADLLEKARADADTVLTELETRLEGLSQAEADSRLKQYGPNEIAREKPPSVLPSGGLLRLCSCIAHAPGADYA